MASLLEQLKQAFSAMAFADIGERTGRRAQHEALYGAAAVPTPTPQPSSAWVALGVANQLSAELVAHVAGLCRRRQANLLLLCRDAALARDLLQPHLPLLEGIQCMAEELPKPTPRNVVGQMAKYPGLQFALTQDAQDPVACLVGRKPGLFELGSPVPVVVMGGLIEQPTVNNAAIAVVGGR